MTYSSNWYTQQFGDADWGPSMDLGGMTPAWGNTSTPVGGFGGVGSWMQNPNFLGALGSGLNELASGLNRSAMLRAMGNAMGGELPYANLTPAMMSELAAAIDRSKAMANELSNMSPNEMTLRAARNAALQSSGAAGVRGPLAANVAAAANNNAYSLWDQWRRQMLMQANNQTAQLLNQQQQMQHALWQRELARRQEAARREAAMMAETDAWLGGLGTILGGIGGLFMGNPVLGASLGRGLFSTAWGLGNSF